MSRKELKYITREQFFIGIHKETLKNFIDSIFDTKVRWDDNWD